MDRTKNFFQRFNLVAQSRASGIPVWQNPQFLFLVMGFIIVLAVILFYIFGTRYIEDPVQAILIIAALTGILFTIDFIITQSFQSIAEASRMKTEFIEIVSHQLRTPISSLRWVAEILMSEKIGKANEQQKEYFGILQENCNRMADLMTKLMAVTKIEGVSYAINKEKINFLDLTQSVIKGFEALAQKNNLKISADLDNNLPEVFTDPFQSKTVMENLLANAINYSHFQNGAAAHEIKEIKVVLKKKGNNIYFEVRDQGVGIPKNDKKYIFQKFFRSQNSLRYKTQGSGLGLYIVRSLVKRLGGKIGFMSEENKGSAFWFTLPIK